MEKDFYSGKISKKEYESQKKVYDNQLENLEAAARIKRLQGRGQEEKTLDYWVEKSKKDQDKKEKEKLLKTYISTPKESKTKKQVSKSLNSKIGTLAAVFLVLAFFIGSGFGIYLINLSGTSMDESALVNETAFPIFEDPRNDTPDLTEDREEPPLETTPTDMDNQDVVDNDEDVDREEDDQPEDSMDNGNNDSSNNDSSNNDSSNNDTG